MKDELITKEEKRQLRKDRQETNRNLRQAGKSAKQAQKGADAAMTVHQETLGLDETPNFKSRKDQFLKAGTDAERKAKAKIIGGMPDPMMEKQSINKADLSKSVQRGQTTTAKISDVLGAFSAGYKGQKYDPIAKRLKQERQEQYKDYSDISGRNKKAIGLWEMQANKQWYDWLNERAKDESLTERERLKAKNEASKAKQAEGQIKLKYKLESESIKAEQRADAAKKKRERTYTDVYDEEYGLDQEFLTEQAAKLFPNATTIKEEHLESAAKHILGQDYNVTVDEEGVISVEPKGEGQPYLEGVKREKAFKIAENALEEAQESFNESRRKDRNNPQSEVSLALKKAQEVYDAAKEEPAESTESTEGGSTLDKYL